MNLDVLRETWVSREKADAHQKLWDKAAQGYAQRPLPDMQTNPFLQILQAKAPLTQETSVLDIGCGAGRYTLALAPYVGQAVGTDLSPAMIEAARNRGQDVPNVRFDCADWNTMDIGKAGYENAFDVVFAHMTPAICDYQSFDKLVRCSKNWCFLVKNTRRHDLVLDAALQAIGLPDWHAKPDEDVANCFHYLWLNGFSPEIQYREEVWRTEKTLEEANGWCCDRARLQREITPEDEKAIAQYLSSAAENGIVKETVTTTVVTMYWQVKKECL